MRPLYFRRKGMTFDGDTHGDLLKIASFFYGNTHTYFRNMASVIMCCGDPTCSGALLPFPSSLPRRWLLFFCFLVSQVGEEQPDRCAFPGPHRRAGASQAVPRQGRIFLERRHGASRLGGIRNCHAPL